MWGDLHYFCYPLIVVPILEERKKTQYCAISWVSLSACLLVFQMRLVPPFLKGEIFLFPTLNIEMTFFRCIHFLQHWKESVFFSQYFFFFLLLFFTPFLIQRPLLPVPFWNCRRRRRHLSWTSKEKSGFCFDLTSPPLAAGLPLHFSSSFFFFVDSPFCPFLLISFFVRHHPSCNTTCTVYWKFSFISKASKLFETERESISRLVFQQQ